MYIVIAYGYTVKVDDYKKNLKNSYKNKKRRTDAVLV